MYAARQVTTEWMTARKPIEGRHADNERRLARITHNDALAGIVGRRSPLARSMVRTQPHPQLTMVKAVVDRIVIAPVGSTGSRRIQPRPRRRRLASLTDAGRPDARLAPHVPARPDNNTATNRTEPASVTLTATP